MIERILNLPQKNSFFLFGPRQTGKTTLIKHFLKDQKHLEFNLLKTDEYRRLVTDPSLFRKEVEFSVRKRGIKKVFVDEIQKIPLLLDEIHFLIEENKDVQFILSGSSERKLKRSNANMLAGRAWNLKLFPFLSAELKEIFSLESALAFGLLPNVYMADTENEKNEILRSYVDTYIREEIQIEANLRNLDSFIRFLPISGIGNSSILNFSNIGVDCAVSSNTVKDYFIILEDTLMGFFLFPYLESSRKRLSKHPKFYFFDTGICRALSNSLSVPIHTSNSVYGKLFEHFVILEVYKYSKYFKLDYEFFYYRTESGAEVDLIIKKPNGKLIAVEIKSTPDPQPKHLGGLNSFKQDKPEAVSILCCQAPRAYELEGVLIMPWSELTNEINKI